MKPSRIPSVSQVAPGVLVSCRYTSGICLIIRADWGTVEVLHGDGTLVKWAFESFRSAHEVVG